MAPTLTAFTNEAPAIVAPDVPNARPLSNPPTITDRNPVSNASTLSSPSTIVVVLLEFGFTLEDSRPIDVQINCLLIDPLRYLAACFGTPTPDQNKNKFLLGKYDLKELHARGILVQEGLEFFFDPALSAPPDVRGSGSTEDSAAEAAESTDVRDAGPTEDSAAVAAESTLAAMRNQIEASQRELAAVQESAPAQALEHSPGGEQLASP